MAWKTLNASGFKLAAAAAGALALWLADRSGRGLNAPDPLRYPVRGLDVSHHQGEIRWEEAARGFAFAYIKASEGGDWKDPRFTANWDGARKAGLSAGAYHFFTFCRDAGAQAGNFLAALGQERQNSLPPAVDLEFGGNCARRPEPEELRRELASFAGKIESALGAAPVYYATAEFLSRYPRAVPADARLWLRSVLVPPELLSDRRWTFWQFNARGRVAGIAGHADLNVFAGSREEWRRFQDRPGWPKTGAWRKAAASL